MSGDDEPEDTPAPEQLSLGEGWLPPAGTEQPTDAAGQPLQEVGTAGTGSGAATRERRLWKTIVGGGLAVLLAGGLAAGLVLGLGGSGNTPQAVVQDFMNNLLSGNYTQVCKDVEPSGQSQCGLAFLFVSEFSKGQLALKGHLSVGGDVIEGSEALVAVSGQVCGPTGSPPQTSCSTNGDPNGGLPASSKAFAAIWAQVSSANSSRFGPIPCVEIGGTWYVHLSLGGLGATGATSTSLQDNDVEAESDVQTALTAVKTYYVENNQTYAGLTPSAFAAIGTGLTAVAGAMPSSGPSVISLLAGAGGTYAVVAAWVPSTQTCWAIMDSAAPNSLDGRRAFVGTLYIKWLGVAQTDCRATAYATGQLPLGSASSANGFGP